ncbi:hypothetical protein BDY19DRAFT_996937 [Irpex rosettiformis]|uniref:Uncharacterized protein n=1 Tax=Irpex rosettiformis TaxID=378272 RepID=A0ACB8TT44_9APHY|nr:hypothetical protein BDY19DRAFT_996937 [Irpex rosettiformis]
MATASAQPIALPSTSQHEDYQMNFGSLTGQNGSFTPASLRRFMGSPISFRAGSFGSRFYPGVSPGQLLGPIDPNDLRFGKMSSSIESDRGSLLNVMNVFDRQEELCRDYQCCGVNLTDMHALVDHFEECHVVVVDPYNPQAALRNLPSVGNAAQPPSVSYFSDGMQGSAVPNYSQGSFDPDDMELDMENTSAPSSGSSSPPDTPISTPLTAYPSVHLQSSLNAPSTSSGLSRQPISAFDTTTVLPSRAGGSPLTVGFPPRCPVSAMAPRAEEAFNAYSGYSEFSSMLPGTVNGAAMQTGDDSFNSPYGRGVPPALLLNSSAATSPSGTPDSSRVASPVSGATNVHPIQPALSGSSQQASSSGASSSQNAAQTARASTTLSRPASSLLLSKPFKCPKPNCNKSYKQANGLKYHMTHGSCNFAPPKDLEQLQALLASRQKEDGGEPLSESELREVEKEAERRLRPYACGVGDCQRRYKNMNGLRYHYQHSGDHGAIGLALLASGQHECLQHTRSHSRHVTPANSNANSQRSSPLATPTVSQAQAAQQSQPSSAYPHINAAPPSYQNASMHPPTYTLQPQQVVPSSQQPSPQQQPASAVPMQMQYMMQMQQQR